MDFSFSLPGANDTRKIVGKKYHLGYDKSSRQRQTFAPAQFQANSAPAGDC
jgi:hypothetical protein